MIDYLMVSFRRDNEALPQTWWPTSSVKALGKALEER
jgi:hypothetical protein